MSLNSRHAIVASRTRASREGNRINGFHSRITSVFELASRLLHLARGPFAPSVPEELPSGQQLVRSWAPACQAGWRRGSAPDPAEELLESPPSVSVEEAAQISLAGERWFAVLLHECRQLERVMVIHEAGQQL